MSGVKKVMGEDVYLHLCSSTGHIPQSLHETSARRECSGGREADDRD